jgi:two-component sensor histidine kinase
MQRKWVHSFLLILIWLFLGLLFDLHAYLNFSGDRAISVNMILYWELPACILWGLLTIPIYRLVQRFPVQSPYIARNTFIHVCLSVPFAIIHITGNFLINWYAGMLFRNMEYISYFSFIEGEFFTRLPWRVVVYLVVVTGCHALIFRDKVIAEQQRSARLEAQVARAELEALKMQLQPHFLFNTLSTISELIHHETDVADEMVVSLGELLRRTLTFSGVQKITLAEELDLLELYLSIQRGRFEHLKVKLKVDDKAKQARVPSLILQPLLENAIKHGAGSAPRSCKIEVSAHVSDSNLMLRVYNDRNENGHSAPGTGVGLANTQERLRLLYGSDCRFQAENVSRNEFEVTIRIPAQYS